MSLRRFGPGKLFIRAMVPSFALALGCSEQQPQRVRLVVAPETTCSSARDWLNDVGCFRVTVCPEVGQDVTECAQVAPEGAIANPEMAGRELVVGVRGTAFGFSVAAAQNVAYNVEITAYTARSGSVLAMGQARGVRFSRGGPNIEVMLSPVDTRAWTCPGGLGERRIERAFHQAVALPTGEVLLIGGINRGFEINAMMLNPSSGLLDGERVVEVFSPGADTLDPVAVVGDASTFSRALFDARWIARDGNVDRIRLFGGVGGTGRVAFSLNSLSAGPVASTGTSVTPPIVDVLYDRVARTITVDREISMVPTTAVESTIGAAPLLDRPQNSQGIYGNAGMNGRFAIVNTPPMISTVDVTMEARRGGTLSRFGPGWLVYGGNDMVVQPMSMRDSGVALLSALGTITAATFPPELEPSAFHTATPVELSTSTATSGDEALVFVGGIPLSPTSDAPLFEPSMSPGLGVRGVRMVGGLIQPLTGSITDPVRERSFHTATVDAQGRVVVVGGAVLPRESPMVTTTRLTSSDSAFAIRVSSTGVMTQEAIATLQHARFGHATTLLPTGRLLVTGGLSNEASAGMYTLVGEPEMLFVATPPAGYDCDLLTQDAGPADAAMTSPLDARVGTDAGILDAGMSMISDAPMSDVPMEDAP